METTPRKLGTGAGGTREGLLNYAEAASYLGISERTVRTFVSERRIAFCRVGRQVRFAPEHLEAYVSERTVAVVR
jgi:excisionase family DNA binding protein